MKAIQIRQKKNNNNQDKHWKTVTIYFSILHRSGPVIIRLKSIFN